MSELRTQSFETMGIEEKDMAIGEEGELIRKTLQEMAFTVDDIEQSMELLKLRLVEMRIVP